jgi:hypothetical protein
VYGLEQQEKESQCRLRFCGDRVAVILQFVCSEGVSATTVLQEVRFFIHGQRNHRTAAWTTWKAKWDLIT